MVHTQAKEIRKDHPRYHSLIIRKKITESFENKVVASAGLIAHGRGAAFDYILGEETCEESIKASKAAIATILLAKLAIISVNGNSIALCPNELVKLSRITGAKLEVNLFYGNKKRIKEINKKLVEEGAQEILGINEHDQKIISEIKSTRRTVDSKGIFISDVVLIPLEDGDRAEALKKMGKTVITIDLNPLSRTSRSSDITIVDNIVRIMPILIKEANKMKSLSNKELKEIKESFDNKDNISKVVLRMLNNLEKASKRV